jgi:hypothetical protein
VPCIREQYVLAELPDLTVAVGALLPPQDSLVD